MSVARAIHFLGFSKKSRLTAICSRSSFLLHLLSIEVHHLIF